MTKPKIKKNLPEKLPPVEPEETAGSKRLKEMEVTSEKVGTPIEEAFIAAGGSAADTQEEQEEQTENVKELKPGTYIKDEPSGKEEQPFLFGEADQILNALETEFAEWKRTYEKIDSSLEKLVKRMEHAEERITSLKLAIDATRKHAPKAEDPAVPEKKEAVAEISHPTEIPEDQEEPETTTSGVKEDEPVAEGAAERSAEREAVQGYRSGTQPVSELLFPGDIVETSWGSGPFKIEEITGPYNTVDNLQEGGEDQSPEHYSLKCYKLDAKRNKDGRLPKNYEYSYLNLVVAVGNRFLSVFEASPDEIFLKGETTEKKKAVQQELPAEGEEDMY